ncbi:MAG: rubredoxin [Oligoflexia bacterium]|nr:rubredoxin [Oligoflexia bacterium]
MKKHRCNICGYLYSFLEGDPENGVDPKIAWEQVPESWVCPVCGVGKDEFSVE